MAISRTFARFRTLVLGFLSRRMLAAVVMVAVSVFVLQPTAAEVAPPLRLSLTALTDELLPCQPLRLLMEARVEGNQPLRGAFWLSVEGGRGLLIVRSPHGERVLGFAQLSGFIASLDWVPPATAATYEPGYTAHADLLVLYDFRAAEYLFPHPGVYEVQALVDVFQGENLESYQPIRVKSNVLRINVKEPERGIAEALWKWPWQAALLMEGDDFRALLYTHEKSSYAQYARFALAQNSDLPATERISLLKDLVEWEAPIQIADLALLQLAELLYAEQAYGESQSYLMQVLDLPMVPEGVKSQADRLLQQISREAEN